ncbi:unnamed protein product [Larinioides sclopetarius]
MGTLTLDEIKKTFQAEFKDGGVRSVWVQGTPLTNLPANLFGNVKSQQFFIEVNSITTVDLRAFSASNKTLHTLSLYGNKIKDLHFSDLNTFENLATLNLGRNQIEIIPLNAFNSRSLYTLNLAQNKIRHIESNAFGNLPRLEKLEMALNQVLAIGPRSFAFKSHSPRLQIDLSANHIFDVDPDGFIGLDPMAIFFSQNELKSLEKEPFADLVTKVAQKGGFLEVSGNPFSCKGCDYSWLVINKDILANKLVGFSCKDKRTLTELTASNIGCHS